MGADSLRVWAIFEKPIEYPNAFVLRILHVIRGAAYAELRPVAVEPSLQRCRDLLPLWLTRWLRQAEDDPSLVESWDLTTQTRRLHDAHPTRRHATGPAVSLQGWLERRLGLELEDAERTEDTRRVRTSIKNMSTPPASPARVPSKRRAA